MLPSQHELLTLLDYDPVSGILTWKPRDKSLFADQRAFASWNTKYAGKPAFTAIDRKGYNVGAINYINYRASRVIFKMVHGIDPIQVDHEDGNTLNNRQYNLRDVSGSVNQQNMKRASNNTSGVTGVCWSNSKNKWEAKIKVRGETIHLGRYHTFNDATAARKAGEQHYGFHPNHGQ